MRVLVGCEFSGVVRDALIAAGHEAMSCDFLPTERPGPHYQGDVFDVIDYPWDLGIFHFPCTHTSVSGAKHFKAKRLDGRQQAGVALFMRGWRAAAHIPRVAFEQPVSILSTLFRQPDQTVQPWMFGHPESKATCLWLRELPLLVATNDVRGQMAGLPRSQRTGSTSHRPGLSAQRTDHASCRVSPRRWLHSGAHCQQWSVLHDRQSNDACNAWCRER